MVTTIQVSDKTKKILDSVKKSQRKTYDQIVMQLLNLQEKHTLREQVADYYATYAKDDSDEVNEWMTSESDADK